MAELFWTLLAVLSLLAAVTCVVATASTTASATNAITWFAFSLGFAAASAFCAGYELNALLWPVEYPLRSAGAITAYLLLGLLYSFARWWSVVFRVRQARAARYKEWLTDQFNRERKALIQQLWDGYVSRCVPAGDRSCHQCQTVTSLLSVITYNCDTTEKPSLVEYFVDCEAKGEINFLVSAGITALPKDWRAKWTDYLSYNGNLTLLEGTSERYYRLNKPAVADNISLMASWIVAWPACLVVNSALNLGQTIGTAALGLVDKLRGVYNRITSAAWREE